MPPIVQVGSILIKDHSQMTQVLDLESEPNAGNWSLVKVLDGFSLDRKIHAAGWNFFFIAAEVKVMFLGASGAKKIQNALKRILGRVRQQHLNGIEVTGIVAQRFLGVPYVTVSAHSHMQQSCYLDGAEARRTVPARRRMGQGVEHFSGPGSEPMKPKENQSLERVLECASVVFWADLMHGAQTGLIHIEYGFAPTGTLDYLKFWLSKSRGHWLLACEYWMSASTFHGTGVRFDNGCQSEGLAHILEFVMQHQQSFVLPLNHGRQGLLQIPTPTEEESTAAAASVDEAFCRLGSALAEPALA